jgi:hypothetical protein
MWKNMKKKIMDPVGVEPHYLPEAEGIFPFKYRRPFYALKKT